MFDGQLVDIYNAQQQPVRVAVAVYFGYNSSNVFRLFGIFGVFCSALLGQIVRHFWDILFGIFGISLRTEGRQGDYLDAIVTGVGYLSAGEDDEQGGLGYRHLRLRLVVFTNKRLQLQQVGCSIVYIPTA